LTTLTMRLAAISCVISVVSCGRAAEPTTRPSVAPGHDEPVWHYDGGEGPQHWGELTPRFALCRAGRQQSPIDIVLPTRGGDVPSVRLQFPPATLRIAHHEHVADGINNGHTIQINYDDGDTLSLGESSFDLVQYHFHSPSEHTLSGRRYPMEMHMVHRSASGALAVVGVLVAQGHHHAAFDPVWTNLPRAKGVETHYEHVTVDVDALLPVSHASYRYQGSLTTPPCTEGVEWIVLSTPIELDRQQIDTFRAIIHDNSRPVQALNGRMVLADTVH
jgi:carbonic anhydrase